MFSGDLMRLDSLSGYSSWRKLILPLLTAISFLQTYKISVDIFTGILLLGFQCYSTLTMLRRRYLMAYVIVLWLFSIFCTPLSQLSLSFSCVCVVDVLTLFVQHIVTALYLDHLWMAATVIFCCKKRLLWWGVTVTLTYVYKDRYSENRLYLVRKWQK